MARQIRHGGGLSYSIKSKPVADGALRPFAVAACHACGAGKEMRLTGPAKNVEQIAQKFHSHGWEFDSFNASRVVCPDCIARRAVARRGDSPKPTPEPQTVERATVTLKPVASPPPSTSASLALPPNKTELTVEERARVRDTLVGTFDEKTGQYSEGWSDIRVAEEVGGVPPKLVADLREIAFGPLRAVAEFEPLAGRLDQVDARVEALLREVASLGEEQGRLRQALAEASKRLGVR